MTTFDTFRPVADASTDLRAVLNFIAPYATVWRYLTPERVGVVVDEPNGSHREISGDELNRAYAIQVDYEPGTIADPLYRPGNLSHDGYRTQDGFEWHLWRVSGQYASGWRFFVKTDDAGIISRGWDETRSGANERIFRAIRKMRQDGAIVPAVQS